MTKFDFGEWTAEVVSSSVHSDTDLVGVLFTQVVTNVHHVGLDLATGKFIDKLPFPPNMARVSEVRALVAYARDVKRKETERRTLEEKQDLFNQLEDAKAEVLRLRERLQMRNSPDNLAAQAEYCAGSCSRGGDGPSCRKMGCVG